MAPVASGSVELITFEPYTRLQYHFTEADYNGAAAVHHDLLEEALEGGHAGAFHVICEPAGLPAAQRSANELNRRLGTQKLHIHDVTGAIRLFRRPQSVILTRFSDIDRTLRARRASGSCCTPVCAVVHATIFQSAQTSYLSALLMMEPHDSIVVSSDAGKLAVEEAFRQTASSIGVLVGGSTPTLKCRVVCIPLGVRHVAFQRVPKEAARQLLGWHSEDVRILYFGRMHEAAKADLDVLLRAIREVQEQASAVRLVLAGQDLAGRYAAALIARVRSLDLEGVVTVIANPPPMYKRLLYSASDFAVFPAESASRHLPALFPAVPDGGRRFWEFFTVNINNANTRRAYFKAVQGVRHVV